MGTQRFDLGKEPFISVGYCSSDLEVRGTDRDDVRIDSEQAELPAVVEGSGLYIEAIEGNATIRLPQKARFQTGEIGTSLLAKYIDGGVTVEDSIGSDAVIRYAGEIAIQGDVGSSLMLKYISGQCTVERVHADLIAKHTQGFEAQSIGASLQAAYVDGDLQVGAVGGDVNLRNITGRINIERVDGSAQIRNAPQGVTIGHIGGDAVVRTACEPGTQNRITCDGSARIRVPNGSDIKFVLPAEANIRLDEAFHTYYEGETLIAIMGEGQAVFHIDAAGDTVITVRGTYGAEEEFDYPLDSELSEELSNLSLQMDEQMSRLETLLGGLGDRIRRRVERKLEVARRRVEEAQRRVEDAVESAVVDVPSATRITINPDMQSDQEAVSEEERLMILKMLEKGTITVEEAQKLLTAIE